MDLVTGFAPRPSYAERRPRLLELLSAMAATGLTGAHTGDGAPCATAMRVPSARHWLVGGFKFFMDGTVEGGTAWLERPDCHGRGTDAFWPGPRRRTPPPYAPCTRPACARPRARSGTRPCATSWTPSPRSGPAVAGPTGQGTSRPSRTNSCPSSRSSASRPRCTRGDGTDESSRRLGSERVARAWRLRDLRKARATLALGSGRPIAHYDVRAVPTTARRPKDAAARRPGLTALQALEGSTSHAAAAAGETGVAGRIAPGHRADLTALSVDPVHAACDELTDAPVVLRVTGGHVVHQAS
ncbi:hypothetical protein Scel_22220 [Streptomyces cellostaticus]|nr:hypothetical protein Scel_22220 [Streptomyces cellostaticus]